MNRLLFLLALTGCLAIASVAPAQWGRNTSNEAAVEKATVPILVVDGLIAERIDPLGSLFGPPTTTLHELVRTVQKAKNDDNVHALVVKFEQPIWGLAQARELAAALYDFRESGKPLHAYFDMATMNTYLAASAADQIASTPVGLLDLHGLAFSLYYFRGLLEKLGMEVDVVNTGKYKNALEPFTHIEMSEGTREQMTALLDDIFADFRTRLAQNRQIDEETAEKILTAGPYTSRSALQAGAIDRVAYLPDLLDEIAEGTEKELTFDTEYSATTRKKPEMPSFMSLFGGGDGGSSKKSQDGSDKIAVVYALGNIIDGRVEKENPFVQQEVIASEDFLDLLEEVSQESGLQALVVRVNSPGGSAIASDRIWNRLERFQQDGIPVIVSMGDVAASGGYYISMGADRIIAEPTTITGSIGVVGGKFTLGRTYEKIGVHKQSLRIGENSNIFDEENPWTEREKEILNALLDDIYEEFTTKAAEGRGMDLEALRALAGGRVWSGQAAKDNGLVDELGGLTEAIQIAREIADAPKASIVEFPKELTIMEAIEKLFSGEASTLVPHHRAGLANNPLLQAAALLIPETHLQQALFLVEQMKDKPSAMLMMPHAIDIQ